MQSLQFFIIFVFCFCLKSNLAKDTITLTQPITDPEYIISNNNAFKLGFFSPVNTTNRYVGIWYHNIPVRTVVWVANKEKPLANSSGTMMISEDGNLVVLNGQKEIIWSSNVSNSSSNSKSAQLLDSGNLVLRNNYNGRTIWESFQYPSDLFLPTMELSNDASTGEKNLLKSWKSPSDPSIGSFSAGINSSSIPEVFIWNGSHPYWRSGPWNGQTFNGIQVKPHYRNTMNFVYDKKGKASMTFTNSNDSVLVFFFLNYNGSLMKMSWVQGMQEPVVTTIVLQSDCDVYGKCGPFGSCNSRDSPICSCLKGFKPKVAEEWDAGNFTSGCVRRTALQCERNSSSSQENKHDWFLKLTTMKVPVSEVVIPGLVSEVDCEIQCLKNCYCAAYAFDLGIGCMLWNGSLIDIQKFSIHGADLYIRLSYSELDKKNIKVVIAISVIIGSLIMTFCGYFTWMWMVKQRGREMLRFKKLLHSHEYLIEMSIRDNLIPDKFEEVPLFKFEKLAIATDKFNVNNKLGQGGFGPVYKGKLPNGQEIAVKRLSRSSLQGLEEFMNEVVVISKLQHRNLVRLLGCCVEGGEKMLIYEYMPNKSLDAFLFDPHKHELLDWSKRLNIIEGIGRGLLYLHRDSRLRIIHRDLKAGNILLDEELSPKISDFGMARIFGSNEDQANTRKVVGTYGYMAPEYAMEGRFSEKSDVFSFGVLLLEIVSGRRNNSFYNDEQYLSLLGFAWKLWNEGNIVALTDPRISRQDLQMKILRCIQIGLLCVQEFAIDRPTISKVLSMLSSEISDLPKPKQPAFTQRPTLPHRESSQQIPSNDITITIIGGR